MDSDISQFMMSRSFVSNSSSTQWGWWPCFESGHSCCWSISNTGYVLFSAMNIRGYQIFKIKNLNLMQVDSYVKLNFRQGLFSTKKTIWGHLSCLTGHWKNTKDFAKNTKENLIFHIFGFFIQFCSWKIILNCIDQFVWSIRFIWYPYCRTLCNFMPYGICHKMAFCQAQPQF